MGLAIIGYAASSGSLRDVYDKMRERPLPPVYRPSHGGAPGIITAHSLDPLLIPRVFATSSTPQRRRSALVARARARQRDDIAPEPVLLLNGMSRRVSACRAR
jgi:hypothetical protein